MHPCSSDLQQTPAEKEAINIEPSSTVSPPLPSPTVPWQRVPPSPRVFYPWQWWFLPTGSASSVCICNRLFPHSSLPFSLLTSNSQWAQESSSAVSQLWQDSRSCEWLLLVPSCNRSIDSFSFPLFTHFSSFSFFSFSSFFSSSTSIFSSFFSASFFFNAALFLFVIDRTAVSTCNSQLSASEHFN